MSYTNSETFVLCRPYTQRPTVCTRCRPQTKKPVYLVSSTRRDLSILLPTTRNLCTGVSSTHQKNCVLCVVQHQETSIPCFVHTQRPVYCLFSTPRHQCSLCRPHQEICVYVSSSPKDLCTACRPQRKSCVLGVIHTQRQHVFHTQRPYYCVIHTLKPMDSVVHILEPVYCFFNTQYCVSCKIRDLCVSYTPRHLCTVSSTHTSAFYTSRDLCTFYHPHAQSFV